MREPTAWVGSYRSAWKFGSVASPKPATPCWAPLTMRNVPSGRAVVDCQLTYRREDGCHVLTGL